MDHLESVSVAFQAVQDLAKASQSLKDFIKLIKEHDRKIRIAYSPESGWPKAKHYENNAVAVDLEDDKRIRIAEREALRVKTGTHAKSHNAEHVPGLHLPAFTQSYSLRRQSKWPVRFFNRFQATNSNPGIPVIMANKALPVRWLLRSFVETVSRQSCPNHHLRKCYLTYAVATNSSTSTRIR